MAIHPRLRINRVSEVRVDLTCERGMSTLRELERFCEELRTAGAEGDLAIGAAKNGTDVSIAGIVKVPAFAREPVEARDA